MEYTTIFHRSPVLLAAVIAVLFLTPGKTRGALGDLDSKFGTSGKVTTDFSGQVELENASAVQSDGRIVVAGKAIGIEPTRDKEAALVQALPAGNYTAIVRGKNGATGVGLVEVYNIQ